MHPEKADASPTTGHREMSHCLATPFVESLGQVSWLQTCHSFLLYVLRRLLLLTLPAPVARRILSHPQGLVQASPSASEKPIWIATFLSAPHDQLPSQNSPFFYINGYRGS